MKIKVYAVDQSTGAETFDGECELDEALERDDPEYAIALGQLLTIGRYWVGGGAAALSLLMRVGRKRAAAEDERQRSYDAANARWPLPISDTSE